MMNGNMTFVMFFKKTSLHLCCFYEYRVGNIRNYTAAG